MSRCSFSSRSLRSVMSCKVPTKLTARRSPGAPWIDRMERRLKVRLNHFHIVRMHQLHNLFDSRLIVGKIENFLTARIPRDDTVERIILPRPELGRVESKLQTIFARQQVLLRLLACADILDHYCVAQWPAGPIANNIGRRARPNHFSVFADIALFHVENG